MAARRSLGKQLPPKPTPGVEELGADARVRAHAFAHALDVRADGIAKIGQVVHERDTRGQHGIGGILGQLRRAAIHDQHAIARTRERGIERLQRGDGARVAGAHDDSVGLHEVAHRVALFQELGVGNHRELAAGVLARDFLDLVACAHRHSGLGHDHGEAGESTRDGFGGGERMAQIGRAVGSGGVPTARKTTALPATAAETSVVKDNRPSRTLCAMSFSSPGS